MRHPFRSSRSIALSGAGALLVLGTCATALGALPVSGKAYSGYTTLPPINGHRGPVSFSVSGSASSLLAFKYGTVGCTSVHSFSGNPYTSALTVIKVGTIPVSATGSFSATNAHSTYRNSKTGRKYVTVSTVAGRFKSAKSATGTISFSQTVTGSGAAKTSCGPYEIHFTAAGK